MKSAPITSKSWPEFSEAKTPALPRAGITSAIGNTPLVRLTNFFKEAPFQLYAKLEMLNPGGSVKDRAALNIIIHAAEAGEVRPGTVVIESSSGNMAIGLAQACLSYGLRFICVVDVKTTKQNVDILRAYGAEVDIVSEPDPVTGEFLQARINRVKILLSAIDGSFWPDQYANLYNAAAHHQTMHEIVTSLNGNVDYFFCATSTCGTLRGCAEYVREHGMKTRIIAVDAVGSIIFGGKPASRLIPGHGAGIRPKLFEADLADECIHVTDLDCVIGCRRLIKREALLVGGSSGGVLAAVEKVKSRIPEGATCAVILADRGERYLDTIYCDVWVKQHFGEAPCQTQDPW